MSVVFILIQLISIILFLKLKKTEKNENIVLWFVLSIIILMCFNIFVTLIFSILKIKSTIFNLSILYIILNIFMVFEIFKSKQTQKYLIKKQDIIISLSILVIVFIIAYVQYKFPFNIKYIITDGAVHYNAMVNFYSSSELLKNVNLLDNFNTFMTGAYVNSGILLKILSSFFAIKNYFSVFVIFDLLLFWLSGELFYLLISKKNTKKSEYLLSFCFTLIYMLGYPLNSLLSGFVYLSLGLDIILAIMILVKYYFERQNPVIIISISLCTLGLFFSYYYFVPVVYLTIFIKIVLNIKKARKIHIQDVVKIFYILIIPTILGIYYMFIKEIFTKKYNIPTNVLKIEGDIYQNFISNIIFFIPFIIYYFIQRNCRKKDIEIKNLFIISILFMLVIFIGNRLNRVSDYYFYKIYYMFWISIIYLTYKAFYVLIYSKKMKQKVASVSIIVYFSGMFISIIFNKSFYLWDIYKYNYENIISDKQISYGSEYLELVEYYNQNLKSNVNNVDILTATTAGKMKWQYVLFQNPMLLYPDEDLLSIEDWVEKKTEEYLIYSKRDYNLEPSENDKNYEIILNNSEGSILRRK